MAYWALIGAISLAELCLYEPTVSVCGRWGEVDNLKGWGTESMVTMMAKMMPWKITDLHFTFEFCIVQFQKISFFGVGVLQHQHISGGSKLCPALKFDGSLETLFITLCYKHGDKKCPTIDDHTGFVLVFRNKFPGLFQDSDWFFKASKIHIDPYTPKISKLILVTALHKLQIFQRSLTDFQNFPGPVTFFQDFPVLENAIIKFQDFPGFPGPVRTLPYCYHAVQKVTIW